MALTVKQQNRTLHTSKTNNNVYVLSIQPKQDFTARMNMNFQSCSGKLGKTCDMHITTTKIWDMVS
jgi:hypothetical protein